MPPSLILTTWQWASLPLTRIITAGIATGQRKERWRSPTINPNSAFSVRPTEFVEEASSLQSSAEFRSGAGFLGSVVANVAARPIECRKARLLQEFSRLPKTKIHDQLFSVESAIFCRPSGSKFAGSNQRSKLTFREGHSESSM